LTSMIRECEKNKSLVKAVLAADRYTCRFCEQVGGQLEVDHIKTFKQIFNEFLVTCKTSGTPLVKSDLLSRALLYEPFWDKLNLRTLCKKCNWARQVELNKGNRYNSTRAGIIEQVLQGQ
jgi:5-methylcytosine-specific restriction endonuclease McrA